MEVVKDSGKLTTVSGDSDRITPLRGITFKEIGHRIDTQQRVIELVRAVSKGEIQIVIEKEYAFHQALEALKKTETRHARGKLIVKGNK